MFCDMWWHIRFHAYVSYSSPLVLWWHLMHSPNFDHINEGDCLKVFIGFWSKQWVKSGSWLRWNFVGTNNNLFLQVGQTEAVSYQGRHFHKVHMLLCGESTHHWGYPWGYHCAAGCSARPIALATLSALYSSINTWLEWGASCQLSILLTSFYKRRA